MGLEPYVPGEQPKGMKYIKLNTNENPYPPSPKVVEAIKGMDGNSLRLYPDPEALLLREELGRYYGLDKSRVFVGNGSDEILAFACMAFFNGDETLVFPDITYSFYPVYCNIFNLKYRTIPLEEDFTINPKSYFKTGGGIILANPNAPTGIFLKLGELEEILGNNMDRVVIVDEAYVDFGGSTAIPLIDKYPNLLVVQTFSKSRSLAGLRIGFAAGHENLMEGLGRVKNSINSYTLDRLAIQAGIQALSDEGWFNETRRNIIDTRIRTEKELKKMGFYMTRSMANFIFTGHDRIPAPRLYRALRERGILVRYFDSPRINGYIRITIGTDGQMDTLIKELGTLLETIE